MSIQIQQRFSTIQLNQLRRLCDESYEGEVYCEESGEPKEKKCDSAHRITNFRIHYCGPEGSDPHHGVEGMRINVEGICYKRRMSLHLDRGVEFNFEGALVSEEDLENKEYVFGPHVETYKKYRKHISMAHPDNPSLQSITAWKYRRDLRAHLTDPENVIPGCPMCALLPTDEQLSENAKEERNKSEATLRDILETHFKEKFPNVRPTWLVNPETGSRMELDCYCASLDLAFEYQGRQHYEPVSFFGGETSFEAQKIRDEHKRQICKKKGITLVEVDGRLYDYSNKKPMKAHVVEVLREIEMAASH